MHAKLNLMLARTELPESVKSIQADRFNKALAATLIHFKFFQANRNWSRVWFKLRGESEL